MAVAALVLAASCATASKPSSPAPQPSPPPAATAPAPAAAQASPPTEADLIAAGARAFTEDRVAEAAKAWAAILDPARRSLYVGFAEAYEAFDAAVTVTELTRAAAGPEAAIAAAATVGPPPTPPLPLEGDAADPRGAAARLERLRSEAAADLVARASEAERAADADLAYARSGVDKDPASVAASALGGFEEAGRLYRGASAYLAGADADALRTEAKAQAATELRKKFLRDSLLSFPERMGEVFARSPATPGGMGDKELLAFNAETAAIIADRLSDFEKAIAEYPGILDPSTLDRLRDSARSLSARFARVESAIRKVKDRGRPVMPLIIGIFNPQPGDPLRSRPASFSGRLRSGSNWWWGIADIPAGVAQDLVITMSDARPVRVYAAGLGSGSGSKRVSSDLVNPLFKVGNSWPVLNAGARLDNGVFHIEVGPSKSEGYSGEAAVYKSFMTRTR